MGNAYPPVSLTPRVRRAAVRGVLLTTELVVELDGVTVPSPFPSPATAQVWRRVRRIAGDVAVLGLAALSGLLPLA